MAVAVLQPPGHLGTVTGERRPVRPALLHAASSTAQFCANTIRDCGQGFILNKRYILFGGMGERQTTVIE